MSRISIDDDDGQSRSSSVLGHSEETSCSSSRSLSCKAQHIETSTIVGAVSGKCDNFEKMARPSDFQLFQQKLHAMRMETGNVNGHFVPDSIDPYAENVEGQQAQAYGSQFSQPSTGFMSEEEFDRLLNSQLPSLQPQSRIADRRTILPQINSCPPAYRSPIPQRESNREEDLEIVSASQFVSASATKKRAAPRKKAAPKAKKQKKPATEEDDSEEEEVRGASRWTDPEVIQLIALRGEMGDEFDRNGKKQGINSWDKIQAKMVTACVNFTKTPEACRKKWKAVHGQYVNDKRLLQISGEGRKIVCRFFEEIDQGWSNRANVRKLTHGDARGTPNPCPLDLNEDAEGQESGGKEGEESGGKEGQESGGKEGQQSGGKEQGSNEEQTSGPNSGKTNNSAGSSKGNNHTNKKTNAEQTIGLMTEMVGVTKCIALDIHETTEVMKGLKTSLDRLIDKL